MNIWYCIAVYYKIIRDKVLFGGGCFVLFNIENIVMITMKHLQVNRFSNEITYGFLMD